MKFLVMKKKRKSMICMDSMDPKSQPPISNLQMPIPFLKISSRLMASIPKMIPPFSIPSIKILQPLRQLTTPNITKNSKDKRGVRGKIETCLLLDID